MDGAQSGRQPIRSYEDFEVYQRAMKLVRPRHVIAAEMPAHERYDLASQARRASKSVPANIAEGYARRASLKEFRNFMRIAMASANEMEVHLKIAAELEYVPEQAAREYVEQYAVVGRQLNRLASGWRQLQPRASSLHRPPANSRRPAASKDGT